MGGAVVSFCPVLSGLKKVWAAPGIPGLRPGLKDIGPPGLQAGMSSSAGSARFISPGRQAWEKERQHLSGLEGRDKKGSGISSKQIETLH